MHRNVITFLLLLAFSTTGRSDTVPDFYSADTATFGFYQRQQWKELVRTGHTYLDAGYDYFYLRMRIGIACFEKKNYLGAIRHFERALAFNAADSMAREYLYSCYLRLGRYQDAESILETIPQQATQEPQSKGSRFIDLIYTETGPLLSSGISSHSRIDLDGNEDIYGELNLTRDSYYQAFGARFRICPQVRLNLGYIVILQGKTKQIMFNDSLAVDEDYPLLQNQIYLSPVLRFRNGFTVIPAFHYLNARFSTTRAAYDMGSNTYRFLSDTFNLNNYIGSLSVSKDISIFTAGLSGAVAYLNGNNHYQADAMLMVYPLGNLNLYAHSSFLMHFAEIPDDSNQQQGSGMQRNVLFTQMIGFKPFPGLWTEGSVSFGEVIEYFDKNSYIVYNLPEKILSKWGFQLYYQIHGHLMLGLKYDNLLREHYYITYLSAESNGRVYQPETVHYHYHQHILIGSLTWTL